jgi:hypothetical protein
MARCVNHLETTASFRCDQCTRPYCEYCTLNSKSLGSCAACGGRLARLPDAPSASPSPRASVAPPTLYTPPKPQTESGGLGWLWFLLIYGVGNLILYKTTGIFLIPIPRR